MNLNHIKYFSALIENPLLFFNVNSNTLVIGIDVIINIDIDNV